MMARANVFMDSFMDKFNQEGFIKDNQPNNGPELDDEFVADQIASFSNILNSGILDVLESRGVIR